MINPSTGAFSYVPNPNFSGTDRLQFTVTDSVGTSKPATVTITVAPSSLGAPTAPANIGVNVEAVSYDDTSQQYVDIVRMGGDWFSTSSDTVNGANQSLVKIGKLDADGWPTEDAGMMMVSGGLASGGAANPGPQSNLTGKYQLSFNGIARLSNNGGTIENQPYDAPANTTTTATVLTTPLGTNGTTAQVRLFSPRASARQLHPSTPA
ncbi:MAG: cadherin-like domain-containing protein [Rhodanobacter sp.]